jgi:hypothetical protein
MKLRLLRLLLLLYQLLLSETRQHPRVERPRVGASPLSLGYAVNSAKHHVAQAGRQASRRTTLARLRAQYRCGELRRQAQKLKRGLAWRLEEDLPRRLEKARYRVRFRSQVLLDRLGSVQSCLCEFGGGRGDSKVGVGVGVHAANPQRWLVMLNDTLQRLWSRRCTGAESGGVGGWSSVAANVMARSGGAPSVADLANRAVKDVLSVSQAPGWVEVAEGHGVTVWRKYLSTEELSGGSGGRQSLAIFMRAADCGSDAQEGPKMTRPTLVPVVKARALVNASAESVYDLLRDNKRVHEYNDNCRVVMDIQRLDKDTKITWAASPRFGPFKPRDFCTFVHFRKTHGLLLVVNVPAEHKKAPLSPAFVRSEILLGGNIIRPVGPCCTEVTMLTSIDTGDLPSAGASLVNKMAASAPISFIRRLEVAAQMDDQLRKL